MFASLPWKAHPTRAQSVMLGLTALGTAAGAWLLFLHLMQTSAPFAEAVAKVSPELANAFSCTCPFCVAACRPPLSEQGVNRFDTGIPSLN